MKEIIKIGQEINNSEIKNDTKYEWNEELLFWKNKQN